jgi:signal transduction histidine kinase
MKPKISGLAERYAAAMRHYLAKGAEAGLRSAVMLGHEAVSLKVETLGLARIHEQSLASLVLTGGSVQVKQTTLFFNRALEPILEASSAVRGSKRHLGRLEKELSRRTGELASSNHELKQGAVRHKALTWALEKSGQDHRKCLEESLQLQKRLSQLTRRVLAAQEDERRNISEKLQNEIAQTLLGINVRLLSLQKEARSQARGFRKGIATTQRMVTQSVRSVQRVVRKGGSL